jgi:hypothetical protein
VSEEKKAAKKSHKYLPTEVNFLVHYDSVKILNNCLYFNSNEPTHQCVQSILNYPLT